MDLHGGGKETAGSMAWQSLVGLSPSSLGENECPFKKTFCVHFCLPFPTRTSPWSSGVVSPCSITGCPVNSCDPAQNKQNMGGLRSCKDLLQIHSLHAAIWIFHLLWYFMLIKCTEEAFVQKQENKKYREKIGTSKEKNEKIHLY